MRSDRKYQSGFGNHFASEALPQALPLGQNSPQRPPYGLIAELLSGSAFTVKRSENQRSWLYRIRPSVLGGDFRPMPRGLIQTGAPRDVVTPAAQLRWNPLPMPQEAKDFVQSLVTFAANGDADAHSGSAVHLYACNRSMETSYFQNADGDFLIVPQSGGLELRTEFGIMDVKPGEIAVIQRGIKFQVRLHEAAARGYICENYGQHFELPNLGPIGSSGLANSRDFETPEAAYEDLSGSFRLQLKFGGELFEAAIDHSPLDVVAWHGNYAPYKYDLSRFNTINTVSYDHPDPSIFTVLTSPTDHEGRANVDFVIFPPRWMVAQHTFRPPYFHRNIMSEYMGLIYGVYDAKPAGGFEPGGGSLHNCMLAHGPETQAFEDATRSKLEPHYIDKTMAFMFESSMLYRPTRFALEGGTLQKDYRACWQGLKPTFDPKRR